MSLSYYRFSNVSLRNKGNPNIIVECTHRAYEDLIQGCKRVADEYRFQNAPTKDLFSIEIGKTPLLDSYGKEIIV